MKKKILLGLVVLLVLAALSLFLLDYFKVFTIEDIKKASLSKVESIPAVDKYLVTKNENKALEDQVKELKGNLEKLQQQNQKLFEELKTRDNIISEQKNNIADLNANIKNIKTDKIAYEEKTKKLADVYSEMDAEKSAQIIPKLNEKLAIDILNQIDEEIVAEILSSMDSGIAADISTRLSY
ncbi:MotE family protein [Orenia marismortui]|uniref:Centromere-associated protein K n=1 Tax=Orenia marismortui TaxID=46469 RepID=A0A4V6QB97_9FIRM|nr:hypothetical protein [Orenia marismortui]TDX51930.1 centromere-associated protein K [Orenia marismortui]